MGIVMLQPPNGLPPGVRVMHPGAPSGPPPKPVLIAKLDPRDRDDKRLAEHAGNMGIVAFSAVIGGQILDEQTVAHEGRLVQIQTVPPLFGWSAQVLPGVEIMVLVWDLPEEDEWRIVGWMPNDSPNRSLPVPHHKFRPFIPQNQNAQRPPDHGDLETAPPDDVHPPADPETSGGG